MKKVLIAVIAILFMSTTTVKAIGPMPQFYVTSNNESITVGDTITLDAILKPNSYNSKYSLSSVFASLVINYDKEVFEYVSYSGKSSTFDTENQSIKFTESVSFEQDEKVGTISLKVKKHPTDGKTIINYYSFYEAKESIGSYSLNIADKKVETVVESNEKEEVKAEDKLFSQENLLFLAAGFAVGGFLTLLVVVLKQKQTN